MWRARAAGTNRTAARRSCSSGTSSATPPAAASMTTTPTSPTPCREAMATAGRTSTTASPGRSRSTERQRLPVPPGGSARCSARTSRWRASRTSRTWSPRWCSPSATSSSACSTSSTATISAATRRFALGYNGPTAEANGYPHKLKSAFDTFEGGSPPDIRVRIAQLALTFLGHSPGGVDGIFGNNTRAALRRFQAAQGMPLTTKLTDPDLDALIANAFGGSLT
jgi:hypothetical protein